MRKLYPFILLALLLAACEQNASQPAASGDELPRPDVHADPNTGEHTEADGRRDGEQDDRTVTPSEAQVGPAISVDLAERSAAGVPTRPRRRMNVDQLSAAMRQVSGGIGWTETRGGAEIDLFERLSTTLGKPDYAEATDEDLDPSTVFQKFLDDAARVTCTRMLARDTELLAAESAGEPIEGTPVLLVHASPEDTYETNADAVDANLIAALQRFHGRVFMDRNDPGLSNWRWLFKSSVFVTGEANQAWLGVCLALFTHPDFYTY